MNCRGLPCTGISATSRFSIAILVVYLVESGIGPTDHIAWMYSWMWEFSRSIFEWNCFPIILYTWSWTHHKRIIKSRTVSGMQLFWRRCNPLKNTKGTAMFRASVCEHASESLLFDFKRLNNSRVPLSTMLSSVHSFHKNCRFLEIYVHSSYNTFFSFHTSSRFASSVCPLRALCW